MPQPTGSPATTITLSRAGTSLGSFREVSGLDSEQEVIEHRETDAHGNPVVRRIPGAAKWSDVTVTRELGTSDELWRWRQSVIMGDFAHARADCTIELLDLEGNAVAAFHLRQAWPARYSVSLTGAGLDQGGRAELSATGDAAVEKLVLAHEGFAR
jgi:phage tail-like protein